MDKQQRQQQLDVEKWEDSAAKGYDTCGSYDYCSACDKSVEFPCATAEEKAAKAAYESKFGPITKSSAATGESYRWLEEPWPWNFEQNEVK